MGVYRGRPRRDVRLTTFLLLPGPVLTPPPPQLDNDGADVDEVDTAAREARRRAHATAGVAARGALSGAPLARRGLRDAAPYRALARRAHPAHHPCVGQRRAEAAPDSGCAPARSPRGRGAIFAHAHRPRARRIRGDIAHTGRAWALVDWAHTRAAARHDGACCALAGRVHGGVGDPEGVGG